MVSSFTELWAPGNFELETLTASLATALQASAARGCIDLLRSPTFVVPKTGTQEILVQEPALSRL